MICFCLLSFFFGLSSRSSFIDTLTTFQASYYFDSTTLTASSSRHGSKSKLLLLSKKGKDEDHHTQETWNQHVSDAYSYAKFIRTVYGKERAIPFYRDILLNLNPKDFSAASRIAATSTNNITSSFGPLIEGKATTSRQRQDIRSFAQILRSSNYTASMVNIIFDAPATFNEQCTATGPIYAKPVTSTYPSKPCPFTFEQAIATATTVKNTTNQQERHATIKNKDEKETKIEESKKCLIALFILGFAVPRNTFISSIVGANETVYLMERLGLIYPCTIDSTLMVPAVSIFPIDINANVSKEQNQVLSLYFVTDWHPAVLSSTTAVGTKGEEEGTVMYIGPDSLALVAHWPVVLSHFPFFKQQQLQFSNDGTINTTKASSFGNHAMDIPRCIKILDLCCGSGIQALSYLSILKYLLSTTEHKIKATCVDINPRALRFTRFNAILNDLDDAVETLEGNVLDWEGIIMRNKNNDDENHNNNMQNITTTATTTMGLSLANCSQLLKSAPYNIILANPPFIPVPPPQTQSKTDCTKIDNANCLNSNNNNSSLLINTISRRYGLFSSGGASGEDILQSIVRVAPHLLAQSNDTISVVAIVSEFMNPDCTLLERISDWWIFHQLNKNNTPKHTNGFSSSHGDATSSSDAAYTDVGVVCTNQFPISAELYASRRAADHDGVEKQRWSKHLEQMGIKFISPGLLFFYRLQETKNNRIKASTARDDDKNNTDEESKKRKGSSNPTQLQSNHIILPKSRLGSIWTPHNYEAVKFAAEKIHDLLHPFKTF